MTRPETGKRYDVEIQDCCVAGAFTARVVTVEGDEEYDYTVTFDNGVILTELLAVSFTEASEPTPEPSPFPCPLHGEDCTWLVPPTP